MTKDEAEALVDEWMGDYSVILPCPAYDDLVNIVMGNGYGQPKSESE